MEVYAVRIIRKLAADSHASSNTAHYMALVDAALRARFVTSDEAARLRQTIAELGVTEAVHA